MKYIFHLPFIIIGMSCSSQNKSAAQKIKCETNNSTLDILKERQLKKQLTVEQLKEEAKKRNIPFRKEEGSKIYELQGFDRNGRPIYYETTSPNSAKRDDTLR